MNSTPSVETQNPAKLEFSTPEGPTITIDANQPVTEEQVFAAQRLMAHMKIELGEHSSTIDRKIYNAVWADSPAVTTTQGRRPYNAEARWSPDAWEARNGKKHLCQEHAVPVFVQLSYVRQAIHDARDPQEVAKFLCAMPVHIITQAENGDLNLAGLKKSMPIDWAPDADGFWARYDKAKIKHGEHKTFNELSGSPATVRRLPKAPIVKSDADAHGTGVCYACGQSVSS